MLLESFRNLATLKNKADLVEQDDGVKLVWNIDTLPTPKGRGILGSSGDCFRKRKSSVA